MVPEFGDVSVREVIEGPYRMIYRISVPTLFVLAVILDALHVATAAVGGVQFLLTQNCRHIANAHMLPRIYMTLADLGFPKLLIYTPAEFLGNS